MGAEEKQERGGIGRKERGGRVEDLLKRQLQE